jgi:hypothetical protein
MTPTPLEPGQRLRVVSCHGAEDRQLLGATRWTGKYVGMCIDNSQVSLLLDDATGRLAFDLARYRFEVCEDVS